MGARRGLAEEPGASIPPPVSSAVAASAANFTLDKPKRVPGGAHGNKIGGCELTIEHEAFNCVEGVPYIEQSPRPGDENSPGLLGLDRDAAR